MSKYEKDEDLQAIMSNLQDGRQVDNIQETSG